MARGWGRNDEDLPADKEQAREKVEGEPPPLDRKRASRRRGIELSLARVAEQLETVTHANRREALLAARQELERQLAEIDRE